MKYLAHSARDGIEEQPYRDHIDRVREIASRCANAAAAYSPKYGEALTNNVEQAALFHDLGKLDDENQTILSGRKKARNLPYPHQDAGTLHLIKERSPHAAVLVYSHHLGLPSFQAERAKGSGREFRVEDNSARKNTDDKLTRYLQRHVLSGEPATHDHQNAAIAPGSLFYRMALSCLVDGDHGDTASNYGNVVPQPALLLKPAERLTMLDAYVAMLEANNASQRSAQRHALYKACRTATAVPNRIAVCDSPVGSGKTTASMAHLLNVAVKDNLRHVFVVLPFTNIIDQSVDIYRKSLCLDGENPNSIVAAHHHRVEYDDPASRVFSFLWHSPVTVTTAVQFFETLAANAPASLRKLHQLAGSAIFIDEAHAALPVHLWPQAWKWLNELVKDWGCYVVMASGSLTHFWELEEFSEPPVRLTGIVPEKLREDAAHFESDRIAYCSRNDQPLDLDNICEWITSLPGPRLLIMNTVQSAAVVARNLRRKNLSVEHISTALAPIHRADALKRVRDRLMVPTDIDWTLVATSCVEAGVDISFRSGARERCSLLSLIQTSGRINRSGDNPRADVWDFEIVPGHYLNQHPAFAVSAKVLSDLFRDVTVSVQYCKEAMRREVRMKNQCTAAEDPIVKAEKHRDYPDVSKEFRVIDSNTVTAVICHDLVERIERGEMITPADLQKYSIQIWGNKISDYALRELDRFPGVMEWTLRYDDFIGYMAGVLEMLDFKHNGQITL